MHTKIGGLTICTDRGAGHAQIISPVTLVRNVEEATAAAAIASSLGAEFTYAIVSPEDVDEWVGSGWTVLGAAVVIKESKR